MTLENHSNSTQLLTADNEREIAMEMVNALRGIICDKHNYSPEARLAAVNTLREMLDLGPSRFFEGT